MTAERLRSPRAKWSLRIVVAIVAGLSPAWLPAAAHAAPAVPDGWETTKWGPLAPADKDLLVGVRRAGLWETPAGQMAMEKGGRERVKEIGKLISEQHVELDGIVRGEAGKLSFVLPNQPNADQQKWLTEMEQAPSGAEFDEVFVDRLRQAHGKVYSLIASVRAGTRNSLMRKFAETCELFVKRHMTYLESTGLVDYDALPTPVGAAPAKPAAAAGAQQGAVADKPLINPASSTSGGLSPLVIWAVLVAAAIAGGLATLRVLRAR